MNGEQIVRDFLREFPGLVLTQEQQDRLAEIIEQEIVEAADDYP